MSEFSLAQKRTLQRGKDTKVVTLSDQTSRRPFPRKAEERIFFPLT